MKRRLVPAAPVWLSAVAVVLVLTLVVAVWPAPGGAFPVLFVVTALVLAAAVLAAVGVVSSKSAGDLQSLIEGMGAFARAEARERIFLDSPQHARELSLALNRLYDRVEERMGSLQQQRNELAAIIAGMVEAVIVLDTNLLVKTMNPAARRIFGVSRPAEGQSLIEICRNSSLDDLARFLVTDQAEGEAAVASRRAEILLADLETTLQVQGASLRSSSGKAWGAVLVMSDISQLKRLESMRRDFVANVSHELKTPITNIKGFVETLREGALDDAVRARDFLGIIEKHTDRLALIVDDLLILTRLENSPPEEGELKNVNLGELVPGVLSLSQARAHARKIKLSVKVPKKDVFLPVYPLLLEQALVNLVDNAIKFSPEKSKITVTVRAAAEHVEIEVKDDGPGIPEREQQRVFERFYRTEKGRTTEGTGLGLSIVKHILLVHKGTVTLSSPPPGELHGTSFLLKIPQRR